MIKNSNFSHSDLRIQIFQKVLINVNLRDAIYDKKTKWPKNFKPKKFGAKKAFRKLKKIQKCVIKLNRLEKKF